MTTKIKIKEDVGDVTITSPVDGQVLTLSGGNIVNATPSAGGHVIQDEGTGLTARANLNFIGAGVTAADDSANNRTNVTIPGGSGSGDVVGPASAVDGHLAVFDGITGKLIKDGGAPGSGGGVATYTSALASPPASPAAGDIWFPTDGLTIGRYSGSAWSMWGPIFPLVTPPAYSAWTWVNQGTGTGSDYSGGVKINAPALSGNNMRILVRAAPSTPYTITALCLLSLQNVNYNAAGLCFRESASGKLATIQWQGATYYAMKFTNPTTFSAAYGNAGTGAAMVWFRIQDNGTNRIVSWSNDGFSFTVLNTVGRTDWLTADQVGFFADSNNASVPVSITVLSWKQE